MSRECVIAELRQEIWVEEQDELGRGEVRFYTRDYTRRGLPRTACTYLCGVTFSLRYPGEPPERHLLPFKLSRPHTILMTPDEVDAWWQAGKFEKSEFFAGVTFMSFEEGTPEDVAKAAKAHNSWDPPDYKKVDGVMQKLAGTDFRSYRAAAEGLAERRKAGHYVPGYYNPCATAKELFKVARSSNNKNWDDYYSWAFSDPV
jgi:hypothetical protein